MKTEFWVGKAKVFEADIQLAPQPGDTVTFAVGTMNVTSRKFYLLGPDPSLHKLLVYGGYTP